MPPHEAAATGGGRCAFSQHLAVEHAALNVEGTACVSAYEATVGAVARGVAVDGDATAAVADTDCAVLGADETGSVLL